MLQAPSKSLKLEKLSKILFTLTLKSGKNYAWKPLKVAIFCRKRPWKPWNRYEKMARHPVWNFIPSLIFRSLALSYRLGNKRWENVRKLGQNMSGNCQECQEFSTLQKSGHSVCSPWTWWLGSFGLEELQAWLIVSQASLSETYKGDYIWWRT